jgi:hypothetical protein
MIQTEDLLTPHDPQTLWIVFSGESDLRWIRWLFKKGFRHCYALINDGSRWITFDPLAHKTEIAVHHQIPADFDLPGWLGARGLKVVAVGTPIFKKKSLPPAFFTCVEAVKRLAGIRKMHIITPFQLYKELTSKADLNPA